MDLRTASGESRTLVFHVAQSNSLGHNRRADRAADAVLAFDTFGLMPDHATAVDFGATRPEDLLSLCAAGESCCLLDGDQVRECLHPPLGYGPASRTNRYETLASLTALLSRQGLVVLVAATRHRRADRETARRLADEQFMEVFVDMPLDVCEKRDVKGLYGKAI